MSFTPPSSRPFSTSDRPRVHEWVKVRNLAPAGALKSGHKSVWLPLAIIIVCVTALAAIGYKMFAGGTAPSKPAGNASPRAAVAPGATERAHAGAVEIQGRPTVSDVHSVTETVDVIIDSNAKLDPKKPLEIKGLENCPVKFDPPVSKNNGAWQITFSFQPVSQATGSFEITNVRYEGKSVAAAPTPVKVSWSLKSVPVVHSQAQPVIKQAKPRRTAGSTKTATQPPAKVTPAPPVPPKSKFTGEVKAKDFKKPG